MQHELEIQGVLAVCRVWGLWFPRWWLIGNGGMHKKMEATLGFRVQNYSSQLGM